MTAEERLEALRGEMRARHREYAEALHAPMWELEDVTKRFRETEAQLRAAERTVRARERAARRAADAT